MPEPEKYEFDRLYGCVTIVPEQRCRIEPPPTRFVLFVAWVLRVLRRMERASISVISKAPTSFSG